MYFVCKSREKKGEVNYKKEKKNEEVVKTYTERKLLILVSPLEKIFIIYS